MSDPREVKKGGFGAFEKQYRDRWAEGHPEKAKKEDAMKAPPAADKPAEPAKP